MAPTDQLPADDAMRGPTPAARAGRRAVGALFLINGALIGVWASRIPAITLQYDLSPAVLGVLLLILALGAVIAFPFSGFFHGPGGCRQGDAGDHRCLCPEPCADSAGT